MEILTETVTEASRVPAVEIGGTVLARNTVLNFAGQAAPVLLALVTIPYVIRGIGVDRFGVLSLALVLVGYFGIVDLGLGRAMTKFVAETLGKGEVERLPGLVWTTLTLHLLLGMAGGLALAVAVPLLVGRVLNVPVGLVAETRTSLFILALSVPVVITTAALCGVLQAAQRFDLVNAVQIPAVSLSYLLPVVAIYFGLKLPGIVLLLVISRFGAAAVYLCLCLRVFPSLRSVLFHSAWVGPLLSYGGWVTVCNITIPVLNTLDRFLIGSLLSIAAVAYYTVPYSVTSKLQIFPASLAGVIFSAFSSLASTRKNDLERLYARSLKSLLLTMGPLVFLIVLFSKDILRLWVGSEFAAKGSLVFQILAVGMLLNALAQVPANLLDGIGRPDLRAKLFLLYVVFYVGTLWFLIRRMDIVGAALAWSLRAGLELLLFFGVTWKIMAFKPGVFFENGLFRALLALAALGSVAVFVPRNVVVAEGTVVILSLSLFGLFAWRYVLDTSERTSLKALVSRNRVVGLGEAK